jgi:aspartate-semialdehyde dehydrogenase
MSRRLYESTPSVAIVGATGAVGQELIGCLERRKFPLSRLKLLASARSAGKKALFRGTEHAIEVLDENAFQGVDIALFAADSDTAKAFAPLAVQAGATVVDNSSAFRMAKDVPLVIPEINAGELTKHKGIIGNPNCTAIISITPLWPIHRKNRVKRLVVSTYQAASGAGQPAMEELVESTRAFVEARPFTPKVLPHPYAFNVFSHDTPIDPETGYNGEEMKVMAETRKIMGAPELLVSATCIRVPVLRAHCVSLTFECERPIAPDEVRAILNDAPGVRIVDDRVRNYFPMPKDASAQDDVLVGRIRQDLSDPSGRSIAWFASGDQLLKGAALNAVQIAELI